MTAKPCQDETDQNSRLGYEDASPDISKKKNYTENNDVLNKEYDHEEATHVALRKGADIERPRRSASMNMTPRRSSLKLKGVPSRARRASIQMGTDSMLYLPGQTEHVQKRRSITFAQQVEVRSIEAMSNMTGTPTHLWFQAEEYKAIRRHSWDLVDRVEKQKKKRGFLGGRGRDHCIRGLERLFNKDDLMRTRHQAWDAVLSAQALQRDHGQFDEDCIAKVYTFSTVDSVTAATMRGKQDELEITHYLKSTRRFCRRLSC